MTIIGGAGISPEELGRILEDIKKAVPDIEDRELIFLDCSTDRSTDRSTEV